MQCSLSVKTSSLLLRRRSHFWSFPGERLSDERAGYTVRGTPRSRPVLPFPRSGTNNTLRLIPFEASGTAGSSPLRGHRFLPTSHNTARLSCSNTRIPDILCQAYVDVIHKRFQLTPFVVTNGAIVIHTQRLKSDPGGNLLS